MEFDEWWKSVENTTRGFTAVELTIAQGYGKNAWQAARTSQQKERHTPGCLAGEERRKNLMRWEPFPDCSCGQD